MQARTTVPRHQLNLLLWALAAIGVALMILVPLSVLDGGPSSSTPVLPGASSLQLAYLEFGIEGDTLWQVDAANPERRQKRFVIKHAAEFGIVPSLAPDRRSFVYTSLPAGIRAPTPDTPAQIWLANLGGNAKHRLLANNADLLVAPVWSPQGDIIVFRRRGSELISLDTASGRERTLVSAANATLFPIAFDGDGAGLYYAAISSKGSALDALDVITGDARQVAVLADGLTRDWKLSPDGTKLAYLVMNMDLGRVTSRAFVLDLSSGEANAVGPETDAFSPAWSNSGELVVGSLGSGSIVSLDADAQSKFTGSGKGFDVPLGFAPAGDVLAVRSFETASVVNPGNPRLEVVSRDGSRKTITSDEVTFLGWIDP